MDRRRRAKPRVLLLAHAYPPDSHAGVELYTARLAAALSALGHPVAVCCGRVRSGRAQASVLREHVDGIDVFGVVQNWPYRDLPEAVADAALDRAFDGVLAETRPDIVAVQSMQGLSIGMVAAARRRGARAVLHLHDAGWTCASGGQRRRPEGALCAPVDPALCGACWDAYRHREGVLERLGRRAARMLSRVPGVAPDVLHRGYLAAPEPMRRALSVLNERGPRQAEPAAAAGAVDPRIEARTAAMQALMGEFAIALSPTRFLPESLAADGLRLPPLVIVPTGVPEAGPLDPPRDGPLSALFLGTVAPHKGAAIFAAAAARASRPLDARVVGPAPFPSYAAAVREAGMGRVQVDGPLQPVEAAATLRGADVLVVPSLWEENAPLVVLEARAASVPVLASRVGGIPELLEDRVDGWLHAPGDVAGLAAQLDVLGDRASLAALRATVRRPRTVPDMAAEISAIYAGVG